MPEGFGGGLVPPALHPAIMPDALFPPAAERIAIDDELTRALAKAESAVHAGPVAARQNVQDCVQALAEFDFAEPRPLGQVLEWMIARMADGVVHVNHPRYFGLFNPAPTFPAQCADRIAASFNPQLATATTSPFPVALEAHVIGAIAARAGLPSGSTGHFTTGGSEANATAIICALTRAEPAFAQHGARAFAAPVRMYTSRDAHLAWLKIAHQTGIGRAALRLVETDGTGRMDPAHLRAAIVDDLANGYNPVMIASTAGTTGAGMIDPLHACADIARDFGLWHHVDAAWGGAVLVSDALRTLLHGIERADSITIDAHKFLATTMGCGMFLTAHRTALSDAFHVAMECMPSNEISWDPYVNTLQWSRRFLGVRLFAGLAAAGWSGYAAHVEKSIALAGVLAASLEARGWSRRNASQLGVLCMRPPPGAPAPHMIAKRVLDTGAAWVSAVTFEGEPTLRFCVTSGEATLQDTDLVIKAIEEVLS